MSDSNREDWMSRFKQNYPLEYSMGFETMARFDDMAQAIYSGTHGLQEKIEMTVTEDPQTQKIHLTMNGMDGLILLGALSRVITQNILSVMDSPETLEDKLILKAKRRFLDQSEKKMQNTICHKCGHNNKYFDNYCTKCGSKLWE
jgi:hypothetical protein